MRIFLLITAGISVYVSYLLWQEPRDLEPRVFRDKLHETVGAVLLDVRTPNEFAEGHIPGAINVDWFSTDFSQQVARLDIERPIFIYCKAGGRSFLAADEMRRRGFSFVTELKGGILKWGTEGLEETPAELTLPKDMTLESFKKLLGSEHLVLVDFFTPWKSDCRKMEVVIDDLSIAYKGGVKVLRINADNHEKMAARLGVRTLPTLQFFENGNLIFSWEGVTGRSRIDREISNYIYSAALNELRIMLAEK